MGLNFSHLWKTLTFTSSHSHIFPCISQTASSSLHSVSISKAFTTSPELPESIKTVDKSKGSMCFVFAFLLTFRFNHFVLFKKQPSLKLLWYHIDLGFLLFPWPFLSPLWGPSPGPFLWACTRWFHVLVASNEHLYYDDFFFCSSSLDLCSELHPDTHLVDISLLLGVQNGTSN